MKIQLSNGDFGTYLLTPVNKRIARQVKEDTGDESILIQTDWDFPSLARTLGWRGKIGRERCQHRGTDGTVTCPDCGLKASDFIGAAIDWLDKHDGCVFVGKGEEYF